VGVACSLVKVGYYGMKKKIDDDSRGTTQMAFDPVVPTFNIHLDSSKWYYT
jgi:hypothetical protein